MAIYNTYSYSYCSRYCTRTRTVHLKQGVASSQSGPSWSGCVPAIVGAVKSAGKTVPYEGSHVRLRTTYTGRTSGCESVDLRALLVCVRAQIRITFELYGRTSAVDLRISTVRAYGTLAVIHQHPPWLVKPQDRKQAPRLYGTWPRPGLVVQARLEDVSRPPTHPTPAEHDDEPATQTDQQQWTGKRRSGSAAIRPDVW